MAQTNARGVAWHALRTWRTSRRPADDIFDDLVGPSRLPPADRAFVLELFYGVLRNFTLLDFWISVLRSGKVDVDLRDILRLGLYQLLIADVREHAAVNETVELAPKRIRGVVNGVLRGAIRQREELLRAAAAQPLSVRTSHPEFLVKRWEEHFGAERTEQLCRWNNEPPSLYARVNQLKIDIDEFSRRHPAAEPISALPNFFQTRRLKAVEFDEAISAGHCYIQDPSTRLAVEMLAPQPGENILDACAAPGGKTSYMAELMQNQGVIVAVDRQSARLEILKENLGRLGTNIAQTMRHDWKGGPISFAEKFDRILMDAPCSNTGVMRRRVDVRWRLRPGEFQIMQQEQLSILRAVVPLLKTNGVLVYSTCSLEPEENRGVIEALQKEMSILRLMEEKESFPFRDGFDGAYIAKLIKTA